MRHLICKSPHSYGPSQPRMQFIISEPSIKVLPCSWWNTKGRRHSQCGYATADKTRNFCQLALTLEIFYWHPVTSYWRISVLILYNGWFRSCWNPRWILVLWPRKEEALRKSHATPYLVRWQEWWVLCPRVQPLKWVRLDIHVHQL